MIAINLLPHHLRPIKRTPLPYVLAGLLLALVLLASASVWVTTQAQVAAKQAELNKNVEELTALDKVVKEYERLQKEKRMLKAKTDTIQEIVKDRVIWSQQLWRLGILAPANVWYDSISVDTLSKVVTKQVQEMKQDPADSTKKIPQMVTKQETIQAPVLKVGGYAIAGEDGSNDISPLLLITAQDEAFAQMFTWEDNESKNEIIDDQPVNHFLITYLILSGGVKP